MRPVLVRSLQSMLGSIEGELWKNRLLSTRHKDLITSTCLVLCVLKSLLRVSETNNHHIPVCRRQGPPQNGKLGSLSFKLLQEGAAPHGKERAAAIPDLEACLVSLRHVKF